MIICQYPNPLMYYFSTTVNTIYHKKIVNQNVNLPAIISFLNFTRACCEGKWFFSRQHCLPIGRTGEATSLWRFLENDVMSRPRASCLVKMIRSLLLKITCFFLPASLHSTRNLKEHQNYQRVINVHNNLTPSTVIDEITQIPKGQLHYPLSILLIF